VTRRVAIYVYDDVEVLDFAGPFEVFSTAARVHRRRAPGEDPLFDVFLVAEQHRTISARAGFSVQPTYAIDTCPRPDVLIVPGGVVDGEIGRQGVIDWIRFTGTLAEILASVCTGAFLLAKAGILDGLDATTHWEDLDDLRRTFPDVNVRDDRRWVEQGAIVTSAGISAGIDMSLHLVARLHGADLARRTARQMDYRWIEDPSAG